MAARFRLHSAQAEQLSKQLRPPQLHAKKGPGFSLYRFMGYIQAVEEGGLQLDKSGAIDTKDTTACLTLEIFDHLAEMWQ